MKIRTRLRIVTAASAALIVIMALLFYWSQYRLATANRAKNLADEIVSSVFERNTLKSDYLSSDNQRAKDQWLSKQIQISDLLKSAPAKLASIGEREIFTEIQDNLEGSSTVFQKIINNRKLARDGRRHQAEATEVENRLVGQLLLKFLDTIADAHRLQKISNQLIESTQSTAAWVSLSIIAFPTMAVCLLVQQMLKESL